MSRSRSTCWSPALAVAARESDARIDDGAERRRPRRRAARRAPWAVYVAIALSGLTALAAEVIWTRILSLLFGATVYTFSLILAVFLVGLGIGSSLGSAIGARSDAAARGAGVVPGAARARRWRGRRTS